MAERPQSEPQAGSSPDSALGGTPEGGDHRARVYSRPAKGAMTGGWRSRNGLVLLLLLAVAIAVGVLWFLAN